MKASMKSTRNSCQNSVILALFYTTIILELAASAVEWHDVTDYGLCLGKDGAVVEIEKADESVTASDGRVPVLLYFEWWDWIPRSYRCGLGSRDRNVSVLAPVLWVFVAVLFQKFWQTISHYQWTHIVCTGRLCSALSWRCGRGRGRGGRGGETCHLKTHAPLRGGVGKNHSYQTFSPSYKTNRNIYKTSRNVRQTFVMFFRTFIHYYIYCLLSIFWDVFRCIGFTAWLNTRSLGRYSSLDLKGRMTQMSTHISSSRHSLSNQSLGGIHVITNNKSNGILSHLWLNGIRRKNPSYKILHFECQDKVM